MLVLTHYTLPPHTCTCLYSLGMVFVSVSDSTDLHQQNDDLMDAARNMGLLELDHQDIQRYSYLNLLCTVVGISGTPYTRMYVAQVLIYTYIHVHAHCTYINFKGCVYIVICIVDIHRRMIKCWHVS